MIFHIAEKARWEAARLAGSYAQSTYGRTLEDEGFIHASREDQWPGVRERFYAGVTAPLVLLVIDTDKLTSPWGEERVGDTTYPHIHGPLNPSAVVATVPLDPEPAEPARAGSTAPAATAPAGTQPAPQSFLSLFVGEFTFRIVWATAAMVLAVVLGFLALYLLGDAWGVAGVALGLVLGWLAGRPFARQRDARLSRH